MINSIITKSSKWRKRSYTTHEIARLCGVFPTTVIYWIKQGKLKAYRTPGGHRRIPHSDLESFIERYQLPISEGAQSRRRWALVVEDEDPIGRLFIRVLRQTVPGLKVVWTKDGIEALLAVGREPPDLIVLDVVMPLLDGARVLATLRSDPHTKHIRVIGITGKRLPPQKLRFMRQHTDAFFHKPFDMRDFARACRSLLDLPVKP